VAKHSNNLWVVSKDNIIVYQTKTYLVGTWVKYTHVHPCSFVVAGADGNPENEHERLFRGCLMAVVAKLDVLVKGNPKVVGRW